MDKKYRNGVIFISIAISASILSRVSTSVEMESLGGNLFSNLLFYSILDMIMAFISFQLIISFNLIDLIKYFFLGPAFFFFLFFFAPLNLNHLTNFLRLSLTFTTLIGKCFSDLSTNFLYASMKFFIPKDSIFPVTMFGMFFSRILLTSLPYINYFIEITFKFHPFIFLSFFWIASRILIIFTNQNDESEKSIVKNEKELEEILIDTK